MKVILVALQVPSSIESAKFFLMEGSQNQVK